MNLNNFKTKPSHLVSLGAMFFGFTLIFLYLTCILPFGRLTMYFIASLFVTGLLVEGEYLWSVCLFVGSSLISLLIMPNLMWVLPYVLFFGHYGIFKHFIERMKEKFLVMIIKYIYFNVCIAAIYFISYSVVFEIVPQLPPVVLIIAAQVVFLVYDYCYSKISWFYVTVIRRVLNK